MTYVKKVLFRIGQSTTGSLLKVIQYTREGSGVIEAVAMDNMDSTQAMLKDTTSLYNVVVEAGVTTVSI